MNYTLLLRIEGTEDIKQALDPDKAQLVMDALIQGGMVVPPRFMSGYIIWEWQHEQHHYRLTASPK